MKHFKVDWRTDLRKGDHVIINGEWAEIYIISSENGIFTSKGNFCRTEIEKESEQPVLAFEI